jgi:hypothetical protein
MSFLCGVWGVCNEYYSAKELHPVIWSSMEGTGGHYSKPALLVDLLHAVLIKCSKKKKFFNTSKFQNKKC